MELTVTQLALKYGYTCLESYPDKKQGIEIYIKEVMLDTHAHVTVRIVLDSFNDIIEEITIHSSLSQVVDFTVKKQHIKIETFKSIEKAAKQLAKLTKEFKFTEVR